MKASFFGSDNSIYLLGLEGRDIFLLRECREVWRRTIDYTNFEIIGVGNNGKVFVKSDEGILVYPAGPLEDEMIIPVFMREIMENESAIVTKIALHKSGERLCVEKVSLKSKLSEKLFKILSSSPRLERGQALHELIFYEMNSGKQVIFHKFTVDRKIPHSFSWNISSDFNYIVWGEAQKVFKGTETRFSAVDVRDGTFYDQFVLEGLTEWVLFINNYGSYLIDSPQRRDMRDLLIGNINAVNFKISVSNEYRPTHLAKDFVAFQSNFAPKIYFKKYDNTSIQEIDLSALEEMNLDFEILFNEQDDINFLVRKSGDVRIVHTNVERLSIDAKRWDMMAEQQKVDLEIEKKRSILEEKKKSLKEKRFQIMAGELTKTAEDSKTDRSKKAGEYIDSRKNDLEKLKQNYLSRNIDKTEYLISKHEIEQELKEYSKLEKIEEQPKGKQKYKQIPLPIKKKDSKETDAKTRTDRLKQKTNKLSLEEELKKYAPDYVEEEKHDSISINDIFEDELDDFSQFQKISPIRMMGPVSEIVESPQNTEENGGVEILSSIDASEKQQTRRRPSTHERFKTSVLPSFEMNPQTRSGKESRQGFEIPQPGKPQEEAESFSHRAEQKTKEDETDKKKTPIKQAPRTARLPNIDIQKYKPGASQSSRREDENRLNEIRRQIEKEIQEAVIKKKRSGRQTDDQRKRYQKLLHELEESYKHGGLSKENYIRLRKKYEEKISKLAEE